MADRSCQKCGGELRRSRRTVVERFFFSEITRCVGCGHRVKKLPIDIRHIHYVKCPRCHSVDLTILKRRDGIDRMQKGPLNFLHRLVGGKLYHCWFCRLQFYDARPRFNGRQKPCQDLSSRPNSKDNVEVPS